MSENKVLLQTKQSSTAQRSEVRNMLNLCDCDKVCVNTEIELFDKVNNCLICDWFTNLF